MPHRTTREKKMCGTLCLASFRPSGFCSPHWLLLCRTRGQTTRRRVVADFCMVQYTVTGKPREALQEREVIVVARLDPRHGATGASPTC